jgi:hypothetical protein
MQFSAFAPFGLASFSGKVPLARRLYEALWSNLNGAGKAENFARGGYTDARVFATAMALARWLTVARKLEAQLRPETVLELLASREDEHGLVVPVGATIAERRLALQVQMRLGLGGSYGNLRQALEDTLGAAFVELGQLPEGSQVSVPADPSPGPGYFIEPQAPRRLFRLRDNLSLVGPRIVAIVRLDGTVPTDEELPLVGESFVVEPEHNVLRERVEILAIGTSPPDCLAYASFSKAHHAGALLVTQPWPYWLSNRRHWVVRLTLEAAQDAETRRRADELMGKLVRGVSTWSLTGNDGPFLLGTSPLGITPLKITLLYL